MAERFTEEQLQAQREIYEFLRTKSLEAESRSISTINIGSGELTDLFNACRITLRPDDQKVLGKGDYVMVVSREPFMFPRFSVRRMTQFARNISPDIGKIRLPQMDMAGQARYIDEATAQFLEGLE